MRILFLKEAELFCNVFKDVLLWGGVHELFYYTIRSLGV